jgi:hypothetical protein
MLDKSHVTIVTKRKIKNCIKNLVNEIHFHLLTSDVHIVNCSQDARLFDDQWEQVIRYYVSELLII